MTKFTDAYLKRLTPRERAYFVTEDGSPGFSVRVSKTTLTFYIVKKVKGKRKTLKIGNYPNVSINEARKHYRDNYSSLEVPTETSSAYVMPLKDIIREYSRAYLRHEVRPRTAKSYEDLLYQFKAEFGEGFDAKTITRRELKQYFKSIASEGHPTKANRMKAAISSLYSWLIDEHEDEEDFPLDLNPCLGIKSFKETVRNRTLSLSELKKLLPALSDSQCQGSMRLALITCFLTCARSSEVHNMMIDELNFDESIWTIPEERTKAGRRLVIPLHEEHCKALKVISEGETGRVFKSPYSASKGINRDGLLQALNRLCSQQEIEHTRVHDLRRTGATQMASLKIDQSIIAKLLNHSEQGMTGRVYNWYDYMDEKRDAVNRLANHYLDLGLRI